MRLAAPLPPRKFLFVCKQKTVKELKSEIRRRLVTIIKEPVAITVNGYELMDDDDVADVLTKDVDIVLHLAKSLDEATADEAVEAGPVVDVTTSPVSQGLLLIRKREHGKGGGGGGGAAKSAKPRRVYPAELAYDMASCAMDSVAESTTDNSDSDDDGSTTSSSSTSSSGSSNSSDSSLSSSSLSSSSSDSSIASESSPDGSDKVDLERLTVSSEPPKMHLE
ncbi:hypothetical protein IWW38_001809 [Coemansia aciculifera]|uniref:Uncharacterized protein n=1 Tax=Coemansia aciculifera TaxID=417176 RepID=A0ACC1M652_9FUNG|nr:hypothetical protein IWW38_001809 [Coemansia aciculifera]